MARGPSQAETVIKTIIRKIIQRCQEKGSTLSETLVGFMVKSVVLDPAASFAVDRTLTQEDVDRLIDLCTARLTDHSSPQLDTIKMQVYFDINYTSRAEFLSEHRRVIKSRLASSVNEICESRARSREELQNLYRRIVSYILLESGLGSPTDIAIVKETTTALQSVFPPAELGSFLEFTRKDKEKHLHELTRIVSGIRLFNKSNGTSSRGIEDLPGILNEAISPAIEDIRQEREAAQRTAHLYTAIIQSKNESLADMDKMMDALYNISQWEVFLRILYNELIKSSKQIETLNNKLADNYKQIQLAVQMRTAVPTRQVYPLFIKLSELWSFFQEEIVLLSVFQNIRTNAKEFIRTQQTLFPTVMLDKCSDGLDVLTQADYTKRAEESGKINGETGKDKNKDINWIYADSLSHNIDIDQLTFQFRSFCPYMLAKHGLLIPGTSSIGILCYDEEFYVFSSVEAASEFANNIDEMISMISDRARVSTELINLVQLQRQFQSLSQQNSAMAKKQPRLQADADTQTDTHIMAPYIDKEYEWNEWEMRRKALKLANLRRYVTHSTQTVFSNYKRENETQVYLPKDNEAQTKTDNATSVPNLKVYYHGLRGVTEPGQFKQVDITDYRDVNPLRK